MSSFSRVLSSLPGPARVYRSRIRFRLRCLLILVDQPVQYMPASQPLYTQIGDRRWQGSSVRWALPAAPMRPMFRAELAKVHAEVREYPAGSYERWRGHGLPAWAAGLTQPRGRRARRLGHDARIDRK